MQEKCAECGEPIIWEEELGSAICTHCGTLSNPSQSVLSAHLEHVDTSGHDYSQYWSNSLRGRSAFKGNNGWNLPGQEKEATYRRNTVQMHEYIRSVTSKLGQTGVTARAQHIFDSAMQNGHYRWGRKAKLAAGGSVAIALREAHKADSIRDIAYLLEDSPVSVSKIFTAITRLLQLSLASADPSHHIPALQTHFVSLVESSQPGAAFPSDLHKSLRLLTPRLPGIIRTANSLSSLVSRLDNIADLPTGPTACAIFILSLEAELASSLPNAGVLAQTLGARVGMSKRVVMERYKVIYDAVEEWIREVPWLEGHERKKTGGRSKVAKRVVVARGLKDVVQFQEELLRQRLEKLSRPTLPLDCDVGETSVDASASGSESGESLVIGGASNSVPNLKVASSSRESGRPCPSQIKRSSAHERAVFNTSQFLRNPLSLPSSSLPVVDTTGSSDPDLFHHLLTVDDASLVHALSGKAPTRLQKLAAVRGGGDEELVGDDELFEDGELDGFLRSAEEIETLQTTFGWGEFVSPSTSGSSLRKSKRKRADDEGHSGSGAKRTKRIDMDALNKILDPDHSLSDEMDGPQFEFADNHAEGLYEDLEDAGSAFLLHGEEVMGEWRPLSPGGGFDDDRYEL